MCCLIFQCLLLPGSQQEVELCSCACNKVLLDMSSKEHVHSVLVKLRRQHDCQMYHSAVYPLLKLAPALQKHRPVQDKLANKGKQTLNSLAMLNP
jgi:hypothetical protein